MQVALQGTLGNHYSHERDAAAQACSQAGELGLPHMDTPGLLTRNSPSSPPPSLCAARLCGPGDAVAGGAPDGAGRHLRQPAGGRAHHAGLPGAGVHALQQRAPGQAGQARGEEAEEAWKGRRRLRCGLEAGGRRRLTGSGLEERGAIGWVGGGESASTSLGVHATWLGD